MEPLTHTELKKFDNRNGKGYACVGKNVGGNHQAFLGVPAGKSVDGHVHFDTSNPVGSYRIFTTHKGWGTLEDKKYDITAAWDSGTIEILGTGLGRKQFELVVEKDGNVIARETK